MSKKLSQEHQEKFKKFSICFYTHQQKNKMKLMSL